MFGIVGTDVPKTEWKVLELPDKNVKVDHCSCDNTGAFSLVISDKGVAYFGGINKKGEAGEPGSKDLHWIIYPSHLHPPTPISWPTAAAAKADEAKAHSETEGSAHSRWSLWCTRHLPHLQRWEGVHVWLSGG